MPSLPERSITLNELEITSLIQLIKSNTTDRSDARPLLPQLEQMRREIQEELKEKTIEFAYRGYSIKGPMEGALKYAVYSFLNTRLIAFYSIDAAIKWIDTRIASTKAAD